MVQIDQTIEINRPVDEVFDFLSHFENIPKWESGVLSAEQTSPGSLGVGATGRDVRSFLGRRTETLYQVTEYEPQRTFAVRSLSGPVSVTASYLFESLGPGTKLRSVGELGLGFPMKLLAPLLAWVVGRQHQRDLGRLKTLLEAVPPES